MSPILHQFQPGLSPDMPAISIVVPCCNALAYTRLCLEALFRHTSPPYQLLLIDNGSTDGTSAYIREAAARATDIEITIIRNEANAGFPAAVHQGLRAASAEHIVLLNNDTIVTHGWMDGLVETACEDPASTAAAGPLSNYAAGAQHIAVDYTDLSGLARFSDNHRQHSDAGSRAVDRLSA